LPFNLETVLGDMCGERLGRIINRKCTVGDGAAGPMGIGDRGPGWDHHGQRSPRSPPTRSS